MISLLNMKEGWDIFYADGPLQIQRIDDVVFSSREDCIFMDDDEAALYVIAKAVIDKSPRHVAALTELYNDTIPVDKSEWVRVCKLARKEFDLDLMKWYLNNEGQSKNNNL